MRNFHQHGIDTRGRASGKIKTICPQCNGTRGHKGDKSLSVDLDRGLCHCHHCGYTLYVPDDAEEREKARRMDSLKKAGKLPSHFRRPTFDPARTTLSQKTERYWTETRHLAQSLLQELHITEQTEWMPQSQAEENCLCFNYFEGDTLVNTKFRSGQKHFKMVKDAELIPYNLNGILGTPECIITEGEFDAASFMTAGRRDVISVPAGAQSNLGWLDRFVDTHFEDKQTIYLAVDEDNAGQLLRQELLRRLGVERCKVVHFDPGCKDANEHLAAYGVESLLICLAQAEELPLEGVLTVDDYHDDFRSLYENGLKRGAETGWENLDRTCTFEPGRLMVVTGRPGDGKSEFMDELAVRLCLRHEWRIGFFSPENMPIVYHLGKLSEKLTGQAFSVGGGMTEGCYVRVERWLADNVSHIFPGNRAYTIDNILDKARQLVRRRGMRTFILDPLNRLERGEADAGLSEMEYITQVLSKLGRFATQHKCLVVLVAHPRKVNRDTMNGELRRVEMNDINGSANFGNMADFCIAIDRNDAKQIVTAFVDKVRFKHLGSRGKATFVYNMVNGRYSPCEEGLVQDADGEHPGPVNTQFDNGNWLDNSVQESCLFD